MHWNCIELHWKIARNGKLWYVVCAIQFYSLLFSNYEFAMHKKCFRLGRRNITEQPFKGPLLLKLSKNKNCLIRIYIKLEISWKSFPFHQNLNTLSHFLDFYQRKKKWKQKAKRTHSLISSANTSNQHHRFKSTDIQISVWLFTSQHLLPLFFFCWRKKVHISPASSPF